MTKANPDKWVVHYTTKGHKNMKSPMNKPERPEEIDAILKSLGSDYPEAFGNMLTSYMTNLENKQPIDVILKDVPAGLAPKHDVVAPARWSHKRSMDRETFRRERAAAKCNNFR
jgi:hypothetical protein